MNKKEIEAKVNDIKTLFEENQELQQMWYRLHTPLVRNRRKVGRNEICPFCDSGKKFKNCECYINNNIEYYNYGKEQNEISQQESSK